MRVNTWRRDQLRDAAVEVLARDGSRGLTHRAVDRAARLPEGTAKNYFGSRDALLQAAAERCVQVYWSELEQALVGTPKLNSRRALVGALRTVLRQATTTRRHRLLAFL